MKPTINKNDTMLGQYSTVYNHYIQCLGNHIAVFMQCGEFYESYCYENENGEYTCNAFELADCMNILIKKHREGPLSKTNPWIAGFPRHQTNKYRNILLSHNYSVIFCDELPSDTTPKQRVVSDIITPGIAPSNKMYHANNVVCLFIEHQNPSLILGEKMNRFDKLELVVGAAAIDVHTNESYVFEVASTYDSILKGESNSVEEIYRFLRSNRCRELSIHLKGFSFDEKNPSNQKKLEKYFVETLGLEEFYIHDIGFNDVPNEWCSPKYINKVFEKAFKHEIAVTTPLEFMEMTYMMNAATALVILLEYIRVRNATLTFNLNKVKHWKSNDRLVLTHNAQQQLGLISYDVNKKKSKQGSFGIERSLFDILDNTSTPMGKRLLEMILLQPFSDPELLKKKYSDLKIVVEKMPGSADILHKTLREVVDLQKLHRKIELKTLAPKSLSKLLSSYFAIKRLFVLVKEDIGLDSVGEETEKEFENYVNILTSTFDKEKLIQCKSSKGVTLNVFQKGISEEIDDLSLRAGGIDQYANKMARNLAILLEENASEDKIEKLVKVEIPAKGGRYFKVPHSVRGALLHYRQLISKAQNARMSYEEMKIPKYPTIEDLFKIHSEEISDVHFSEWGRKMMAKSKVAPENPKTYLTLDEIRLVDSCGKFSALKSSSKVYCKLVEDAELSSESVISSFVEAMTHIYFEYLHALYSMNTKTLEKVTSWVANLDVLKSNAVAAFKGRYACPQAVLLSKDGGSYIRAKNVRHPIAEIIQSDISFVGNDIRLGFKPDEDSKEPSSNGIFIHCVNNGGKSTYLRSVALNIIMAQCGMFVPAESFEFAPFGNIITRLSGNDNMYKRQGSFAVEMAELRTVMNQSGPRTLVLGDEICRGTEQKSALAIVAASAVKLCKKKTNFLFSTHLRALPDLEDVENLTKTSIDGHISETKPNHTLLRHCFFTTILDKDEIIFEYKLREGMGQNLYGIEIAEMMGLDPETCKLAYKYRNIIENPEIHDIPIGGNVKSRYNSELLRGICEIEGCEKRATETHHIRKQSEADKEGFIEHFHKDSYFNLVGLCEYHHHEQHHGKIKIIGKAQTSKGVKLLFDE